MDCSCDKLLILIRHGERTDQIKNQSKIPCKFGKYDPDLTENGKKQVYKAGLFISKQLESLNFNKEKTKIKIYSSPFIRTLQSSRELIKGLEFHNQYQVDKTIYVNYHLAEWIGYVFEGHVPKEFLNIILNTDVYKEEFKNDNIKIVTEDLSILPDKEEETEKMFERAQIFLEDLKKDIKQNDTFNVFIAVAHGSPIDGINIKCGYPGKKGWPEIKYCDMFYYNIGNNGEDNKFMYKKILNE